MNAPVLETPTYNDLNDDLNDNLNDGKNNNAEDAVDLSESWERGDQSMTQRTGIVVKEGEEEGEESLSLSARQYELNSPTAASAASTGGRLVSFDVVEVAAAACGLEQQVLLPSALLLQRVQRGRTR